ncbi:MAG TPA: NTP transferase domain-containing protein [Candidatus Tumulicola sp.]|jgi:molybdenum cofactor cytidylyltransferase
MYIVLAAGASSRMGREKLAAPLAGRSPLGRLANMLRDRTVLLIASRDKAYQYGQLMPAATVLINENPANGMTSSLRVALSSIGDCERAGIVLADKPLLLRATLEGLEAVAGATASDIVFPQSAGGEPGHPVYLSQRALAAVASLPDGDSLRALRSNPNLAALAVPSEDPGAFIDVDTEEDWQKAEAIARQLDRSAV